MPENFYDLLGVDEDATKTDLKRAYRQRAREYHPDVNADDRAGTQFKTVRRAYDVLRDETERSAYDRLGHETYVRKRMNGLPSSPDESSTTSASASSSTQSSSSSQSSNASTTSSSSTSSQSSKTSKQSKQSKTSKSSRSQSSQRSTSSQSASNSSSSGRRTRQQSTASRSSTSPSGQTGTDRTTSSRTTRTSSTTQSLSGRRTRLRNRWLGVFLALSVYVGGFASFVAANLSAIDALLARLTSDPASALTAGWGLGDPTAYVQTLVADPSLVLLFPLGAVLLPVALATTVLKFGRGAAWFYLLGAVGPLVGFAAGPALPEMAGVDLALFVVLPLLAALVFLGDVGRYLVATR
ncbi:DnaJ domain-containing protein [Halogranum rubrum]|uniref:J domain-containing protein n=1 Tax=Halogranum salarium B-1 TaxID=1210908 RepID=J3EYC6_9EURY|nr:DnaJ domain-containing protein [Halogranum salarium]EJN60317.1 hypothetical protein HSB1_09200 [Halogranum salarium B-1]